MADEIQWLREVREGLWTKLGTAMDAGLPVPCGFVATPRSSERNIRDAYEELKVREHTHYVAVRTSAKALIDVIGSDALMHALRAIWTETAGEEVLIQSMVNGLWCGKAVWEAKNLRIRAAAGLLALDPDMYLFNTLNHKCSRRTLYQRPRKVFRGVDGTTRTMEVNGERRALEWKYMELISELATRAGSNITWVLDDRRAWLLNCE